MACAEKMCTTIAFPKPKRSLVWLIERFKNGVYCQTISQLHNNVRYIQLVLLFDASRKVVLTELTQRHLSTEIIRMKFFKTVFVVFEICESDCRFSLGFLHRSDLQCN